MPIVLFVFIILTFIPQPFTIVILNLLAVVIYLHFRIEVHIKVQTIILYVPALYFVRVNPCL